MNPTDQARKEARKRELKKNKKQRTLVRLAVLKNKDPSVIVNEMRALDLLEFDPVNTPPYNLKVLHEKRKKLRETWDRIMRLYSKDDTTKMNEMKKTEQEYERWKKELCNFYDSVQQTRRVKVDEIPLPSQASSNSLLSYLLSPNEIPLPVNAGEAEGSDVAGVKQFRTDCSSTVVKRFLEPSQTVNCVAIEAAMKAAAAVLAAKPDFFKQAAQGELSPAKGILRRQESCREVVADPPIPLTRSSRFNDAPRPPGPPPGASPYISDYDDSSDDNDALEPEAQGYRSEVRGMRCRKQLRFEEEVFAEPSTSPHRQPARVRASPEERDWTSEMVAGAHGRRASADDEAMVGHPYSAQDPSCLSEQPCRAMPDEHANRQMYPHLSGNSATTFNQRIPTADKQLMGMSCQMGDLRHAFRPGNPRFAVCPQRDPSVLHPFVALSMGKQRHNADHQGSNPGKTSVIQAKPQLKGRMTSITKLVPTVLKVKRSSTRAGFVSGDNRFGESGELTHRAGRSTDIAYDAFMKEMENVLK